MATVIDGTVLATASGVSLEVVGEKNYAVLVLAFSAHKVLSGVEYKAIMPTTVRKTFFLTTDPITRGANTGKTQLEVTRKQLKEVFGYEGGLSEEELSAGIVGKEAQLVCKPKTYKDKTYTEVMYVNVVGGSSNNTNKKAIDAATLAKLESQWSGKPISANPADSVWGKVA